MGINFSNGKSLVQTGGRLSVPGRIVQVVNTTSTTSISTASTSPVDLITSNSITLTNPNNKILIEFHSDNRTNDWGDGVWNLYYMDLIHVQSGTQITYSGYRGEQTMSIRHFHKQAIHTPGTVGPHSYKTRGWSYSASTTTFNGPGWVDNDGITYIRLMEVAV
jgi:hypothetical protein